MESTGSLLAEQFERAFTMLRDNIQALTDEEWTSEELRVPARYAYHAILATSNYNRTNRTDPFPVLECNWQGSVDQLPSRSEVLDYLASVKTAVREQLCTVTDDWFSEPTAFSWTGSNRLAQYVYSLRHLTYHSGEISMSLRFVGKDETAWA